MVGLQILILAIEVRILAPQPLIPNSLISIDLQAQGPLWARVFTCARLTMN